MADGEGTSTNGRILAWVDYAAQKLMIPLLIWLAWQTMVLAAEIDKKKDSLEAAREHSELREGIRSNQLLRDQPPDWFVRWSDSLDKRLQRIEDRQQ